jgi:hypothetical protein
MKRQILIFIIILTAQASFSQIRDKEIRCSPVPIVVNKLNRKIVDNEIVDSVYTIKILRCISSSPIGLRFGVGFSYYYYNKSTSDWLGNHGGPDFSITLAIENANFGLRFKPWTMNPQNPIEINGDILPMAAKLNPVKINYFFSYNFNIQHDITLEPAIGYSACSFIVLNEDDLGQEFNIPKTGGLLTSFTINKYLRFKYNEFFSIFTTAEYAFVDYSKLNPELDNGYFSWTIGLAFKGYFKKQVLKRVKE